MPVRPTPPPAESAQQRKLAFLEAFALGSDPPLRPTIQDLERYASQWAPLYQHLLVLLAGAV